MTISEKINEIKPYFSSFEIINSYLVVRVKFPSAWKYFSAKSGKISANLNEENNGYSTSSTDDKTICYIAKDSDSDFDEIIDFVKSTVDYNMTAQLKKALLEAKIQELKNIFERKKYEELKNLQFTFASDPQENTAKETTEDLSKKICKKIPKIKIPKPENKDSLSLNKAEDTKYVITKS